MPRYSINHTKEHGSWSYTSHADPPKGGYYTCRYNHRLQTAYITKTGKIRHYESGYSITSDYHDLVTQTGKYERLKEAVERDFSANVFKSLIQKIKQGYIKPVASEGAGADDLDDSSINATTIEEGISEKDLPPKPEVETPPASEPPKSTKRQILYNNHQDWTKTGDSLQSFTWESLKKGQFKNIPTFVKVLIYPFAALLILLPLMTLLDAIPKGRVIMIFVALLSIGLGLLLLFGMADYWTRRVNRYTKSDIHLIKGRTLFEALRQHLGKKVHKAHPPEYSLQDAYKTIIKGRNINREHIYIGDDFMVGYCELFYTSGAGSRKYTTQRSCFALKLNYDVPKKFTMGKRLSPWFEEQIGVDLSKYLNTKGFILQSEGNHVILLFQDVLYKSEYILEIFKSLVAAMESR